MVSPDDDEEMLHAQQMREQSRLAKQEAWAKLNPSAPPPQSGRRRVPRRGETLSQPERSCGDRKSESAHKRPAEASRTRSTSMESCTSASLDIIDEGDESTVDEFGGVESFTASSRTRSIGSSFDVPMAGIDGRQEEFRTSLLLQNLPATFSQKDLLALLDRVGLCGGYDFVYLPVDVITGASFGYAHVNFVDVATAESARWRLEDRIQPNAPRPGCRCIASCSPMHQGLESMMAQLCVKKCPMCAKCHWCLEP